MKHIGRTLVFLLHFFAVYHHQVSAQAPIISEVYPAPLTGESEWVELYNPSSTPITLTGYTLKDLLTTPSVLYISGTEVLGPLAYKAIVLSGSKLNNTGDTVQLLDPNGILVDTLSYTSSTNGQSWQRMTTVSTECVLAVPSFGLVNTLFPLVAPTPSPSSTITATASAQVTTDPTPSATSSALTSALQPTPSATPLPTSTPAAISLADTMTQLALSEFHPCPEGGVEWLELYNEGKEAVTVTGLRISDESGNYRTLSGTVPALGYAVLSWSGSLLNNAGDSFEVNTEQGRILAQVEYSACDSSTSYVYTLTPTASWKKAHPSPGMSNQPPLSAIPTTPHVTPTAELTQIQTTSAPASVAASPRAFIQSSNVIVLPTLTASDSASLSAQTISPELPIASNYPVLEAIQRGVSYVFVLACVGCITSGTLILYEKIKHYSMAID